MLYEQIEAQLTELLGCEDSLVLPTITHIHMSVIPLLAASGTIFLDARAHKTIYDGCQVARARGAAVRRFRFEDPEHLDELLSAEPDRTRLVCMDGVNSMTGNAPDLQAFAEVARRHGALLYVDDAHGFGVIGERRPDETSPYGARGNSVVRHVGESYDGMVLVGGFSKAYSSLLAFIACPTEVKQLLKVAAPPYLYSGPSPVASLATVLAGFEVNERRGDALRADLHALTARMLAALDRLDVETPNRSGLPIIEIPVRQHEDIGEVGRFLFERRLRDARGVPARAQGRGRLPRPADGSEHGGRGRPGDPASRRWWSAACCAAPAQPHEEALREDRRTSGATTAWAVYLVVGTLLCGVYLAVPPFKGSGPLMNLIGLSPVIAILVGITWHRPASRLPWYLLAGGSALFWLGDLYTYSYPHLLGAEVPFPSLGDAFYVAMYPVMMAGLLLLVRRRSRVGSQRDRGRPDPDRRPLTPGVDHADGAVPAPG